MILPTNPPALAPHIVHDDVKGADPVCRNEQQLVRVCLVRQGVNVPDLALGNELELWHVGVFERRHLGIICVDY